MSNDNSGLVAIVTRTKNRPVMLARAIQSVLAQTHSDWIHVIVNDGGDAAPIDRLVEKHHATYADRVAVIHNERSLGMEAASNIGLRGTSSKFVVILDDDDTWHASFLEECLKRLEKKKYPAIAGVITHSDRVTEEVVGTEIRQLLKEPFNHYLTLVTLGEICGGNVFTVNSFMYERSVFDKIGMYREDLPVLGDWEFNVRFLTHFDIDVIPKRLSNFHIRTQSQADDYGNTVTAGLSDHYYFFSMIQNEYLRRDLESGKFGLGFLMSLNHGFKNIQEGVREVERNNLAARMVKKLKKTFNAE